MKSWLADRVLLHLVNRHGYDGLFAYMHGDDLGFLLRQLRWHHRWERQGKPGG